MTAPKLLDLIRALKGPVYCSFVRADIRDSAVGGVETREITYTPPVHASCKDVILVDGILQSGMTFDHLYRYLTGQGPSSLRTMVLVEKTDERKVDLPLDFIGFKATPATALRADRWSQASEKRERVSSLIPRPPRWEKVGVWALLELTLMTAPSKTSQ